MNNKKILYIINHMDWFWSHRLPLARGARDGGWSVIVAATGAGSDKNLAKHGFIGLDLPVPSGSAGIFNTMLGIHNTIRETQPDLIHVITLKYAFLAGLTARLHPRVKIVHTIAGLGYLFSGDGFKPALLRLVAGPFLKLALKSKNAQIIFQNPDDMKLMIARGFVHEDQCHLIRGSGVDTEKFVYVPEPHDIVPVVVMPTRLVHDKGVRIFAEAAHILESRSLHAVFQIAGGLDAHNPRAYSCREIENLTKDGIVKWLGKVDDMPALLAGANLVVYPSWYREGVPKVLLEAASAGRAIVTTDHPGCREAVANGDNGLLVPVKDANATADAIEKLLRSRELRAQMGARGRERALAEFDVNIIVHKTLAVYGS